MRTPAVIRRAHPGDAEAIAAVHERTWRETYTGLIPEAVIAGRAARGHERWSEWLEDPFGPAHWVAARGAETVGFAVARAAGPGHPAPLELVALYVLAAEHGTGTGQRLLDITVGDAPCYLWVARDNPRAVAFYRRNGFEPDGAAQLVEAWGGLPVIRMVR